MTHLRKMMLEEFQHRNHAGTTINCYLRTVEDFSQHFNGSPDRLGPRHIREYQAELFQKRKFSLNTVAQRPAALRFFCTKTLKKVWSIEETPYPGKILHMPTILSQEEVARLIDAARPPLHRTLLMALYATGLRRAEQTCLSHDDSSSMPSVLLVCAHPSHLSTKPPRHSIPMGTASAATTVGSVQTALSKPRRSNVPRHTLLKARLRQSTNVSG